MSLERIKRLIDEPESIHLEFKEVVCDLPKNLFETICARLNCNGSDILSGVTNEDATFRTIITIGINEPVGAIDGAESKERTNDGVKRGLIDAVNAALIGAVECIVSKENGVTINEVMNKTGKSNASAKRFLKILKTIDLVEFKGTAKAGKYFIKPNALFKMKRNFKSKWKD